MYNLGLDSIGIENHIMIKKSIKGGNYMSEEKNLSEEEVKQQLQKQLERIKNQDAELRRARGEKEPYKAETKDGKIVVYTNDKKAMKFWEE